jgi:membrane protease YdiL (CAAX protease family)
VTSDPPDLPESPGPASIDDAIPPVIPARPGLSTFTIEGRAAPGLFVVGWLAAISGVALLLIGILAPSAVFFYFFGPLLLTIGLVAGAGNQAIERRRAGAPYAGPSPFLVLGAIVAAVVAVGSGVFLALGLVTDRTSVPPVAIDLITIGVQTLVFVGVVRLTVVGTDALTWSEMGWRRFDRVQLQNLLLGAAVTVPVILGTSILANLAFEIFHQTPESPLPPTGTFPGLIVQLVAGAVLAPLAEETVFRGFAMTAWSRTVGERSALIRVSLIFAVAHVINAGGDDFGAVLGLMVIGFVTRLPVSFALGWLFLRTRSIWTPLGLHIAFNATLLILAEAYLRPG